MEDNANPFENPHALSSHDIADRLEVNRHIGLSEDEVAQRIKVYGLNRYHEQKQISVFLLLLEQFKSPIILLLVGATVLSFFFQQWLEGFSIIGVIVITVAVGFFMELQARKSMTALKEMDVSVSRVLRNSEVQEIPSEQIVPGDILLLEAGDIVPADGRVFEVNQFEVDESVLTGESMPVVKSLEILEKNISQADRTNMIFKGTSVVRGNAKVIVTGTGLFTELGKISSLVESSEQVVTPLEKKLQGLTTKLMWITGALAVIFIVIGLLHGKELFTIIETAIALAVAAIPEGLPVVSTIALTYGMLRMARKNVLIKRLASVETLGGINTIFTDKTGTLTENKIKVDTLSFYDEFIQIGNGEGKKSEVTTEGNVLGLNKVFLISTLCNNAVRDGQEKQLGDPIEISLLEFIASNKINATDLNKDYPRIAEQAFSSETKLMATLHKNGEACFVAAKGALEELIQKCNFFCNQNEVIPLTALDRKIFLDKAEEIQAQGSRVLAFAFREADTIAQDDFLNNLILAGFIGFLDPPRLDVIGALQSCRDAGIKVIMITGDHPATARNIAQKINLSETNHNVIHGKELEGHQTDEKLFDATIFARVSPRQKLDMVTFYQMRGDIVAMTGDGINDAPALKKADIGIAMGLRGTQVAKETADMVLKDDSFISIVAAIKQGRIIFQNIKRFLIYLLSCNLSEILVIFSCGLLNFPFSVFPMQILFLNLVTDIFPALALGVGKGNDLIMKNPPRNPQDPIITKKDWSTIVLYAIALAIPILSVSWYSSYGLHLATGVSNNITFLSLALSQLWHVFNLSSRKMSFFRNEITRNKFIWGATLLCVAIILISYWVDPLRVVLNIQTLNATAWFLIAVASTTPVILIQLLKRLFSMGN